MKDKIIAITGASSGIGAADDRSAASVNPCEAVKS